MSDTNNNIPTRITQLEEATEYEDGMFFAVAKAGRGTYKIPVDEMTPNEQALSDKIENEIVPAVENSFAYGTVDESEIASFPDGSNLPMPKLEVAVEPQQDLHGYDAPWVGGAGKNKFDITESSRVVDGVTFTVNDDGTVVANGTSNAAVRSAFLIGMYTITDNTVLINGCPSGGASNKFELMAFANNKATSDYGNGASLSTFSVGDTIQILAIVRAGYTANNLVFYPMIRLATVSDPTFAPYSNICPISGWDECKVTVADDTTDPTTENVYTIDLDGTRYGGTLDVISGVLTVDKGYVDLGTLNWAYSSISERFYVGASALGVKATDASTPFNAISSALIAKSYNEIEAKTVDNAIGINPNATQLFARCSSITSASAFITAMNGVQLVYELATPLEVQLTPTQVSSLMGVNNIFANTGNILKVEYIRDLDIVINSLLERIAALEG